MAAIAASLLVALGASAAEVTLESLLTEMTDRDRLARLPDPAYSCRQASSYDRRATDPEDPSTWYANMDRSYFVRTEQNADRTEHVLMDEAGPGAVVRFWATWHGPGGGPFSNGTLRVYLDQEAAPAIEGPIADVLDGDMLCGPPLSQGVSPLTDEARRGHNLYLPIPYAQHCKITYETPAPVDPGAHSGEALYYQINFRTYSAGTEVESFRMAQVAEAADSLARTQRSLLNPWPRPRGASTVASLAGDLPPGETREIALTGPGAIRELALRLEAEDLPQALRSTVLEITFNGEAAVWCPLGAFFGTGPRLSPHKTWVTEVSDDGLMRTWWVMPFAEECRIVLRNRGTQPVRIATGDVRHSRWQWDDASMHFHATWRQWTRLETQTNEGADHGAFDVNYVTVDGDGVYVGDTLTLFNGSAGWWGEGDEKIYVDGESFPSHFGTGTEDYYGYAWSNPNFFEAPFHAQPYGNGANQTDLAVNSRYRALDAIPFRQSLRVDMEVWHWHKTRMTFAPATFWYARPGAECPLGQDPAVELPIARNVDDVVEMVREPGAIEGEGLESVQTTGGETEIQDIPSFGWSGNQQLWWRDASPGDTLTVAFPVETAGTYDVHLRLTRAIDYGRVQFAVNGANQGPKIELYRDPLDTYTLTLPAVSLHAGNNTLEIRITGAHPDAVPRHMAGLDYIKLQPAGEAGGP
jgi:hypothetical protein